MNETNQPKSPPPSPRPNESAAFRKWLLAAGAMGACFSVPLYHLVVFALGSDLYSHILLVPFVSLYLVWIKRTTLPQPADPDGRAALVFFIGGALVLAGVWSAPATGLNLTREDTLAAQVLAFLLMLTGTCAAFLGRATLRAVAFPLCFLIFMAPLPSAFRSGLETFLQHGSAQVAYVLFKTAGTTVFSHDLMFRLPGINLEVAPECSGIRSSLALFITSLLAGHFFLRTPWKCALLTVAVIPLAIVRNGFRIFTVGELCVHYGPDMINSYIHRQGGPIFFVLSLIPFLFLLRLLLKSERRGPKA